MHRRLMFVLASLLLLPCFLFAQDGKVRGRVTAKESGEALIGANVVLDGTTLGAAADINGDFVILSVPPGVYTVRATYIGYQTVAIGNVRVSANLTTTQDFDLPSSAIAVEAMEIVAERPLIQRNTTNTVRLTTAEDIENLPVRGVQNILALNAGTVLQDGDLHVRGSRSNEVAYYVDGATATNPYSNEENITVINEAIEELQLQSGGFTAELGGANSAVVRTTVKTGTADFKATVDYLTDDFAKSGDEFLGTTSRGFRNAVVTLSGPLLGSKLRYFVAGQHNYFRNRTSTFIEPLNFTELVDDGLEDGNATGTPLPAPVKFEKNYLPNNQQRSNSMNGTLVYDMSSALKFRVTGTYSYDRRRLGFNSFYNALNNLFWEREQRQEVKSGLVALKGTHVLNPTTFYEVNLSYSSRNRRDFDPDFGDDWTKYSDRRAYAAAGIDTSRWRSLFQGPLNYSTIFNFTIKSPNAPINDYTRDQQKSLGGSLDFTSQVTKNFELKFGGRVDTWKMRFYQVNNIRGYLQYLYGIDGQTNRTFANEYVRRVELARGNIGSIYYYGWDVDGINEVNSGVNGPTTPLFASSYVQSKLEYRDLILNFGLRYERIDAKVLRPDNFESPTFDKTNDYIDESTLTESPANDYLLPRVNFAFPVTDRTVFYAQYGKYLQMPSLNDLYGGGVRRMSDRINPQSRVIYSIGVGGNANVSGVGYEAKPERSEQYELGIRQSLTDNFAFTVTTFYKELQDLLRLDRVVADGTGTLERGTPIYTGWLNTDFGTSKGLELTLELRRTKRLAVKLSHTLSDTRGTGSDSRQTRVAVSDDPNGRYPTLIYRLNYNQAHRGTISLDYRFGSKDGGAILQGLGINALVNYNSGHSFTQVAEPLNLGQATAWTVGTRATADPRTRNPIEPINSSTTPWNLNVDLTADKLINVGAINARIYANVLNLFNTKNIINVFESTGTADDDGWLKSSLASQYLNIPYYEDFYRAINLENGWGYRYATSNNIYGAPREVRFGLALEF